MDDFTIIVLVAIGVVGYLFIFPLFLRARIGRLEEKVKRLAQQVSFKEGEVPANEQVAQSYEQTELGGPSPIPAPRPMAAAYEQAQSAVTEIEPESGFFHWLKEDFLVKMGAFLLILALAWFVSYAFANAWIGPFGQIMLGLLLGAGILVFGTVRIRQYANQGAIFVVLGAGFVIVTITAAQYIYDMFPSLFALLMMFMMVVYVTFVSLQYERSSLAYAGLSMALLAPFLINEPDSSPVMFMLYLLLVVVGTLWVVWRLRAEKITLVALIGVVVYTTMAYNLDQGVALLFSFLFTGIFFVTNIVSLIRRYTEWVSPVHVLTALVTGLYLISSIVASAPEEWMSSYLLLWALIFTYGSYQVYIRTLNKIPFYIYSGVCLTLLGIATTIELSGAWLTIMLTLEVLTGVLVLGKVTRDRTVLNVATALFIAPGLYTLEHLDSYSWHSLSQIPWSHLLALLVFTGALILTGMFRSSAVALAGDSTFSTGQRILYSVAGIYSVMIIWLTLHVIFSDTIATMLSHIIYSVTGLVLYIAGKDQMDSGLKTAGKVVLGLVIAKLLLDDVWDLDTFGRIVTFLVIGLLFMSTAFLPKLNKTSNEN